MPGRPEAQDVKHRKLLDIKAQTEKNAVDAYNTALAAWAEGSGVKKPTFRGIAKPFGIDYCLLQRRVEGTGTSKAQSNADKSHLLEAEALVLIDTMIEQAYRCFPWSLRDLELNALEIIQTRKPDFTGFGKNWTHRFLVKYGARVSTKWATSLDTIRAKSISKVVLEHYTSLLGDVIKTHNIDPGDTYGFDETGVPLGGGDHKKRVIGPKGLKQVKKQGDANKEQMTGMCTICADGTADVPPVVIFPGQNFLEKWLQENPISAA